MYNKTSDGWIYTVDGADWGDAEYSSYGTTFELDSQILERLARGEVVTTGIVDVPIWGQLMSTFTPIKDSQGVVTGYLGIDVSAAEINRVSATTLNNTYRSVIPIFVVVLVLSLLVMLFVVRGILRQVNDIKLSLDQVSNGNLNIVSRHMTNDQLGDISNLINVMVNQLTNILNGIQQGSSMLQQSSKKLQEQP